MRVHILQRLRSSLWGTRVGSSDRVALRWVKANISKEYDIMLRLQMLEGAAGVPIGTWWKKGKRGLPLAIRAFKETGARIKPIWFTAEDTATASGLLRTLQHILDGMKTTTEAGDFLDIALMGLSFSGSGHTVRAIPYGVGETSSTKIRSGKETPQSLSKGPLRKQLLGKILNEKRDRDPEEIRHPNWLQEEPDPSPESLPTVWEFLGGVVFHERSDRLGKLIRKKMRTVWDNPQKFYRAVMLFWLSNMERGHLTSKKELAVFEGVSATQITRRWKMAWADFFKAFYADRNLVMAILHRVDEEGITKGDLRKPNLSKVPFGDLQNPLSILQPRERG